jgi:hypothetical protein
MPWVAYRWQLGGRGETKSQESALLAEFMMADVMTYVIQCTLCGHGDYMYVDVE